MTEDGPNAHLTAPIWHWGIYVTEQVQAVIDGTRHRFRPILMTATVAVLGLLPASLSAGIGSDVQRPLATVIVYGLLFATVITLYALPVLYYLVERRHLARKKPEPEEV